MRETRIVLGTGRKVVRTRKESSIKWKGKELKSELLSSSRLSSQQTSLHPCKIVKPSSGVHPVLRPPGGQDVTSLSSIIVVVVAPTHPPLSPRVEIPGVSQGVVQRKRTRMSYLLSEVARALAPDCHCTP